jgi:predicted RNA-binding Zn ribbon-like protein
VFDLSGGLLCVDFTNTVSGRYSGPRELLRGYADLIAWSRQAGGISADDAESLLEAAEDDPEAAGRVLQQAIRLRETLYRILSAVAAGGPAPGKDLAAMNVELQRGLSNACIEPGAEGFRWNWSARPLTLERPLWPVVRSAADLLTSDQLSRLRICASDTCLWLFMDASRNRSRRWCDMKVCGNRAKVQRHYHKTKVDAERGTTVVLPHQ